MSCFLRQNKLERQGRSPGRFLPVLASGSLEFLSRKIQKSGGALMRAIERTAEFIDSFAARSIENVYW